MKKKIPVWKKKKKEKEKKKKGKKKKKKKKKKSSLKYKKSVGIWQFHKRMQLIFNMFSYVQTVYVVQFGPLTMLLSVFFSVVEF